MNKVNRVQELRRSNAATAIPSKKKYNRKQKYKNKFEQLQKFSNRLSRRHAVYGDEFISLTSHT